MGKTPALLVRGARQLLTLRGPAEARRGALLRDLAIIPDGALLIRNGIVEEVGPSRRVEHLAAARGAVEINATGRVVMPAFVDGMTRLAFTHALPPMVEETDKDGRRPFQEAIRESARTLKSTSRKRLEMRCKTLLDDMVRHGTCTVEAQTGYGQDHSDELKMLRVHSAFQSSPASVVSTYALNSVPPAEKMGMPLTYLQEYAWPLLQTIRRRKLARFLDITCGAHAYHGEELLPFLKSVRTLGFGIKIQAQQFHADSSAALAVETEAISAGHMNFASLADICLLAKSRVIVSLAPGYSYHCGVTTNCPVRFAPARAMIDRGVAVSLCSHFNAETSPSYSMPFVLSLACHYLGMTPAEAISAATVNAAWAAGRGEQVGSLEPGKQADVLLLNVRDYREIPYHAGVNPIYLTIKNGQVIYRQSAVGVTGQ